MKKTLLSIVAIASMMVMVACNNSAKFVDAQVKLANAYTAKLDSVNTIEAINALQTEYATALTEATKGSEGVTYSEEETAAITAANTALMTKSQEVVTKIQAELQAAADAAAAEAAALAAAEEEAAKGKGKSKK